MKKYLIDQFSQFDPSLYERKDGSLKKFDKFLDAWESSLSRALGKRNLSYTYFIIQKNSDLIDFLGAFYWYLDSVTSRLTSMTSSLHNITVKVNEDRESVVVYFNSLEKLPMPRVLEYRKLLARDHISNFLTNEGKSFAFVLNTDFMLALHKPEIIQTKREIRG